MAESSEIKQKNIIKLHDVISFMKEYAGEKPNEEITNSKKPLDLRIYFNSFCGKIAERYSLKLEAHEHWQRGYAYLNYYWNRLYKEEWKNRSQCIAVFLNKENISVKIEIKNKEAREVDYEMQSKILEWIPKGNRKYEYCIIGITRKKNKDKDKYDINEKFIQDGLDRETAIKVYNNEMNENKYYGIKVQLVSNITNLQEKSEEEIFNEVCQVVYEFIPAYDYIMGYADKNVHNEKSISQKIDSSKLSNTKILYKSPISLNTILYGPPGTGKTYESAIYAVAICEKEKTLDDLQNEVKEKGYKRFLENYKKLWVENVMEKEGKENQDSENPRICFITFHQSYSYEEFIEGIKPDCSQDGKELNYKKEDGIFKKFCKNASKHRGEKFVFIIDEINRGNISKIFGELITLIEDTKRDDESKESIKVKLPYTGEWFSVPNNVYILGTMNTADRSIALMDTALRRRFSFIEMMPKLELLKNLIIKDNVTVENILEKINERIEVLYDREHTIGHAYFTSLLKKNDNGNVDINDLGAIFKNKIIPLLQEYFYDDYEKIALVLGENIEKMEGDTNIVIKIKNDDNLFHSANSKELVSNNPVYRINECAFKNPNTYIQMYKKLQNTDKSKEQSNAEGNTSS